MNNNAANESGIADNGQQGRMSCMEVWGGNVQTARSFETSGLDVWISCQPEGQAKAGGDVYYVSSCASGRITRLMLADVSGHGQLVAGIAERLRDLMRHNINTIGHRPFVSAMNNTFTDQTEGCRFATAVVGTYFAPTRSLAICIAGHPPPLVFRAAEQRWSILDTSDGLQDESRSKAANLPLGVISDTAYSEHSLRLREGDMVLCYTDAFSEARGPDGKMLGVNGILSAVASSPSSSAAEILSRMARSLRSHSQAHGQEDDATLLLFRANGKRSTLRDNLAAPFRLLRPAASQVSIVPPDPRPESALQQGVSP